MTTDERRRLTLADSLADYIEKCAAMEEEIHRLKTERDKDRRLLLDIEGALEKAVGSNGHPMNLLSALIEKAQMNGGK